MVLSFTSFYFTEVDPRPILSYRSISRKILRSGSWIYKSLETLILFRNSATSFIGIELLLLKMDF